MLRQRTQPGFCLKSTAECCNKEPKLAFSWRALFECCNREPKLALSWRALFECCDREPKLAFAWRALFECCDRELNLAFAWRTLFECCKFFFLWHCRAQRTKPRVLPAPHKVDIAKSQAIGVKVTKKQNQPLGMVRKTTFLKLWHWEEAKR